MKLILILFVAFHFTDGDMAENSKEKAIEYLTGNWKKWYKLFDVDHDGVVTLDDIESYKLGVNFEECKGSATSINELHKRCMNLTPPPTKDVIAKIVVRLFQVEPRMHFQNGERFVVYNNLRSRKDSNQNMCYPPFCKVTEQTSCRLQIECPLTTMINGKLETCTVSFSNSDTVLFVTEQHIKCGYSLPLVQMTIDGIIHALHCIRICKGVPYTEKLPKSFEKETISMIHNENTVRLIGRSRSCKKLIPLCGKTDSCKTCTDSYNKYNRRADKLVTAEICDKTRVSEEPPAKQPRVPLCDSTNIASNTKTIPNPTHIQSDVVINPSIDLNKESHADMKSILGDILKDGNAGEFQTLLESQLRNCNNQLEIHHRRWDPKVISICLGILLRSPQAYQNLKDSGLLVLPSRRSLQYYKNIVKQHPGFNAQNLDWMQKEATRKNISKFGLHGGILIDEMTIQDDLIISRTGDTWSIVGMLDMGDTNNAIKVLTDGKKKVEMATHALQFVFHGFTGFRVNFANLSNFGVNHMRIIASTIDRLCDAVIFNGKSEISEEDFVKKLKARFETNKEKLIAALYHFEKEWIEVFDLNTDKMVSEEEYLLNCKALGYDTMTSEELIESYNFVNGTIPLEEVVLSWLQFITGTNASSNDIVKLAAEHGLSG